MKAAEIRDLTIEEIDKQCQELKRELLNLRIQSRLGSLENPARIKTVKKIIARLLTEKNSRKDTKE